MLLFVLGVILAVIALILFGVGRVDVEGDDKPRSTRGAAVALLLFGLFLVLFSSVRVIDAGQVGVPVTFGTVGGEVPAGVSFVAPWTGIEGVDIRTQNYTMTSSNIEGQVKGDDSIAVTGLGGSTATVDATVLYRVDQNKAAGMFRDIGTAYENNIVRPTSRTCIRDAFGPVNVVDGATTSREQVTASINKCIGDAFISRGLVLESFQLRAVNLSKELQDSVNSKQAAQQVSEQKKFELVTASQDAEKTRIQSVAVSDGQQIIKCGGHVVKADDGSTTIVPNTGDQCQNQLTPEYLEWFYIDMLKSVVSSPNHDTIIVPSRPDGQGSDTDLQVQIPAQK